MRELVKAFKALSDGNRIRILKMLEARPLCVCEITSVLGLAASTVSKHLSVLREAGFISDKKEGKWVTYYLNRQNTDEYVSKLLSLIRVWLPDDKTIEEDRIKAGRIDREQACKV
ncbi:MAG: winged helix-turn-helix transcriptional regulator [Calditrichaeota bacterium]|nr:winged helix-turn-helix transcriptional regulator [Calditrichota bacterium]